MKPAPIIIFVYNRPEHTQRTLTALQNNFLYKESKKFIFSDGAKSEKDIQKVNEVRGFIKSNFDNPNVKIFEREKNYGLAESIINGVTEIINNYGKAIVIEDDIITSQYFLNFVNQALEFYSSDKFIFSITGYSFPISIPKYYNKDIYLSPRSSSWGWGTWADRWEKANWGVNSFEAFRKDKVKQKAFNKGGEDLTPMLKSFKLGLNDSWAIRWAYSHHTENAYCIYPIKSLVKNIGMDGSGTHFKAPSFKFDSNVDSTFNSFKFDHNLEIDEIINRNILKLLKPSLIRRISNFFKLDLSAKY